LAFFIAEMTPRTTIPFVMPGLVPGIHVLLLRQDVDGRDKPGHDAILVTPSRLTSRQRSAAFINSKPHRALPDRGDHPLSAAAASSSETMGIVMGRWLANRGGGAMEVLGRGC
jgi:hypothetical protein